MSQSQALSSLLVILWIVGVIIYRLAFHPLAKYPGPLGAKLTGWYGFGAVSAGRQHAFLEELHHKYGSVVRTGPNRLSYNTIEGVRSIYSDRKANVNKAGFVEVLARLKGERNLQTLNDRHAYAVRRRLISHAFSEEALKSSQQYILPAVDLWCQKLGSTAAPSQWSADINMCDWANFLTIDILGELCFGESFGSCNAASSPYARTITEGAKQAQILTAIPAGERFYDLLRRYVAIARQKRWEAVRPQLEFDDAMDGMMARRMNLADKDRKDFFHYILQARDPETGEQLNHMGMNVESGVLFGAGVDTSAACIAACLFYLTRHPEPLARLQREIRSTFSRLDEICHGPQLQSLHYLRACIDETLRMSPPAPGPMLRKVTDGGVVIDGDVIPEGTEVSVPAYVIHHNPAYYPNPWSFKPERWLSTKDSGEEEIVQLKLAKEAFLAFSAGARVCIGRGLAYLDMSLALARLLFQFDIRQSPGNHVGEEHHQGDARGDKGVTVQYAMKDWFVTERDGPIIQIRRRDTSV